jgi:hypothetical protein
MAVSRKDKYGRLAQECLSMVQTVSTEEARSAFIEMARVWTRLADEQDKPVIQQQQQQPLNPNKDENGE